MISYVKLDLPQFGVPVINIKLGFTNLMGCFNSFNEAWIKSEIHLALLRVHPIECLPASSWQFLNGLQFSPLHPWSKSRPWNCLKYYDYFFKWSELLSSPRSRHQVPEYCQWHNLKPLSPKVSAECRHPIFYRVLFWSNPCWFCPHFEAQCQWGKASWPSPESPFHCDLWTLWICFPQRHRAHCELGSAELYPMLSGKWPCCQTTQLFCKVSSNSHPSTSSCPYLICRTQFAPKWSICDSKNVAKRINQLHSCWISTQKWLVFCQPTYLV